MTNETFDKSFTTNETFDNDELTLIYLHQAVAVKGLNLVHQVFAFMCNLIYLEGHDEPR